MTDSRIEELRRRLRDDPGSRLFAQLAEEERKAGALEEAIRIARAGLAVHGWHPTALVTLGRALLQGGDAEGARAALAEALKQAPESILAGRFLAQALEAVGDGAGALEQYRATSRLAPGDRQLAERVAALEGRLARRGGDVEVAAKVPGVDADGEALRARTGSSGRGADEAVEARGKSEEGQVAQGPRGGAPPFSSSTLAELYLRQGFVEEALEVYRQVVATRPGDERARRRLAEIASLRGKGGEAGGEEESRRRALVRAIAGLEVLLGVARRR